MRADRSYYRWPHAKAVRAHEQEQRDSRADPRDGGIFVGTFSPVEVQTRDFRHHRRRQAGRPQRTGSVQSGEHLSDAPQARRVGTRWRIRRAPVLAWSAPINEVLHRPDVHAHGSERRPLSRRRWLSLNCRRIEKHTVTWTRGIPSRASASGHALSIHPAGFRAGDGWRFRVFGRPGGYALRWMPAAETSCGVIKQALGIGGSAVSYSRSRGGNSSRLLTGWQ